MKEKSSAVKEALWTRGFILACLANFLMSFAFYLLVTTLPLYLVKELSIDHSKVGIVLSSYTLAMLFARAFSGYLVDTISRKRLFMFSLIVFSILFGGYIRATTVAAFMILRFFHGAAWGVTTVSGNTIAIDIIPSSRRAEGIGFYGLNMNISMAIAPWIGLLVYDNWGYLSLVLCCLFTGFAALVTVRSMDIKPREHKKEPVPKLSLDRFILIKALPVGVNLILCAVAYGALISYGALYGEEIKIGNPGIMFLFMAVGLGSSRIFSGRLVDKGNLHKVSVFAMLLLTASFVIFASANNIYAYCTASLMIGVGFGSIVPAFQTMFVNMGKHNQRGTANSTYLTSFDMGIGAGMLMGGYVSSFANLSAVYLASAALCAIAAVYYLTITMPVYNNSRKNKRKEEIIQQI
ncbi:MAG: MFS transporter [Prevotellaceae bacterium]|jgi:predicted MFS family arabinose efflux permease|nr:MFS transporter [Prevotellaceae bacterium]